MALTKVIVLLLKLLEEGQGGKGSRGRRLSGRLGASRRRFHPTVGLYIASHGGPRRGGGVSYERGTPVD